MSSNSAAGAEKPHPVFKVGPIATGRGENISACAWKYERQTDDGRTYFVYAMEPGSSFFSQKDNAWKSARGFRVNQLATLDFAIRKCTEFIFNAKNPQSAGEDGGDVTY